MKGMGRVYDHVTPEMERQILESLEERFVTSVLALAQDVQEKLLAWVPVIKDTIGKAQCEAEILAAKLVGGKRFCQISPTEPTNENSSGAKSLLTCGYCWVELRGFDPLSSSMPWISDLPAASLAPSACVHGSPARSAASYRGCLPASLPCGGHRESDVAPRYLASKRSSDSPVSPRKTA